MGEKRPGQVDDHGHTSLHEWPPCRLPAAGRRGPSPARRLNWIEICAAGLCACGPSLAPEAEPLAQRGEAANKAFANHSPSSPAAPAAEPAPPPVADSHAAQPGEMASPGGSTAAPQPETKRPQPPVAVSSHAPGGGQIGAAAGISPGPRPAPPGDARHATETTASAAEGRSPTRSPVVAPPSGRDHGPTQGVSSGLLVLPGAEMATGWASLTAQIQDLEAAAQADDGSSDGVGEHLRADYAALETWAGQLAERCWRRAALPANAELSGRCLALDDIARVYQLAQVATEWVAFLRDACGLALVCRRDADGQISSLLPEQATPPAVRVPLASVARPLARFIEEIDLVAADSPEPLPRLTFLGCHLRQALPGLSCLARGQVVARPQKRVGRVIAGEAPPRGTRERKVRAPTGQDAG